MIKHDQRVKIWRGGSQSKKGDCTLWSIYQLGLNILTVLFSCLQVLQKETKGYSIGTDYLI